MTSVQKRFIGQKPTMATGNFLASHLAEARDFPAKRNAALSPEETPKLTLCVLRLAGILGALRAAVDCKNRYPRLDQLAWSWEHRARVDRQPITDQAARSPGRPETGTGALLIREEPLAAKVNAYTMI